MAQKPVVTRFAPSPTGALHIGGARTALFNWLYARATQGQFLLRIEDTDIERSTSAHESDILTGLAWLGLDWDAPPIKQSANATRHQDVATQMLANGSAYKDGDALRLCIPKDDKIQINDAVQKTVQWNTNEFNDTVLLRSDGSPTYTLAVVVDDHDMGVTHVIRGDDHLINAPIQKMIYDAMSWDCPIFAHIPLIHGEDGGKLSKRHGATALLDYARLGYTPEGLRNALTRLGWSHGDDELFTTPQAIKWFDLSGIKKSPAQFNMKKLDHINAHHIKTTDTDTLFGHLMDYADFIKTPLTDAEKTRLKPAMPFLRERAKTLDIILDNAAFARISRPITPETDLDEDAKSILKQLTPVLTSANWEREDLMQIVKDFAQMQGITMGQATAPLRIALSGKSKSPSVFDMLCFLGVEESLARINDQINK
ncbi:MAG: glutamate--tRNA ligase [Candidatus Halichondribacter symbioticus]